MIRNRLEHSSLRIHEDFASGLSPDLEIFSSRLAFSIARGDLNTKTLRLFKLGRAAMIYLLLGMHREEARVVATEKDLSFPMEITAVDDDWKR